MNTMWMIAKGQQDKGDEYHFAKAFQWLVGSYTYKCFPDRFVDPETLEEVEEKIKLEDENDGTDPR